AKACLWWRAKNRAKKWALGKIGESFFEGSICGNLELPITSNGSACPLPLIILSRHDSVSPHDFAPSSFCQHRRLPPNATKDGRPPELGFRISFGTREFGIRNSPEEGAFPFWRAMRTPPMLT